MTRHSEIRERLERRRDELRARLDALASDTGRAGHPLDPDFAEQAVERETEEVNDALDAAGREELAAIKRALEHIDNDDYGICAKCGKDIPPQRLEILPFSDRCVACADT